MSTFDYYAPTTALAATSLLSQYPDAKILAGGTDLLVQLRAGLTTSTIVDVKKIPELTSLLLDHQGLNIGASVPGAQITARQDIVAKYPGLVEAIDLIGSTQVQGRCSVGGNLCNASPAADTVPALIVNRAICEIQGSKANREVAVEHFVQGPGVNCLAADEMLVSLRLPKPAVRSADAYQRFIPRTEMDIAVAGVAIWLALDDEGVCLDARVAIGAVAPTALLVPAAAKAIIGSQLEAPALASLGQAVSDAANPISDKRGSIEYRKKIVAVLARRVAVLAQQRAQLNA